MPPWIAANDGLVLSVRLTPKGGRDAIEGVVRLADSQEVLQVRVKAAPSEGEANAALRKLIARAVGVAGQNVTLSSGATARLKRLKITGDTETLIQALTKIVDVGVPA